jgi:hypothetical protein
MHERLIARPATAVRIHRLGAEDRWRCVMEEQPGLDIVDDIEQAQPGTSATLTAEGWEDTEYVQPGDDWTLQEDGSMLSPDGTIRTWGPSSPTGN